MARKGWLWVRLAFVGLWAFAGLTNDHARVFEPSLMGTAVPLAFAFLVGVLGTRFTVIREYKKQNHSEPWLLPAWKENPFQRSQPIQFFHLVGVSFLLFGIASVVRYIVSGGSLTAWPSVTFAGALGAGTLSGIWFATHAYKDRFVSRANDRA